MEPSHGIAALKRLRWAIGISGALSIVFGVAPLQHL
jgi:hypothetical protein